MGVYFYGDLCFLKFKSLLFLRIGSIGIETHISKLIQRLTKNVEGKLA